MPNTNFIGQAKTKFVKKEGWDPSYIITSYGKIFRVNLLGVVVSKNINDCVLDDGTGKPLISKKVMELMKKGW